MAAHPQPELAAVERHFSVQEIAQLWQVSDDTVRRTFTREPGVLTIGRGRRSLLRIPESVLERVHRRMSNGETAPPVRKRS